MTKRMWVSATLLVVALVFGVAVATAAARFSGAGCHHKCQTTTVATTPTTSPPTTAAAPTYLFDDEFNGPAGSQPSSSLWTAKTGTPGSGICTWGGWNQVREDGSGDLAVTAQKDSSGSWSCGYLAGRVAYSGPRRVEFRARMACGAGTWNALWDTYNGAPQLENDVNEQLGREPQTYHASLHYWYAPGQNHAINRSVATGQDLCGSFHTYTEDVYSDHADFYFDGALVETETAASIDLSDLTTWQDTVRIWLNMGGSWAGTPTISGPVSMLVDYVRVTLLP